MMIMLLLPLMMVMVMTDDNLRSVSGYNLGGSYISSSGSSYSFTSGNQSGTFYLKYHP